MPKIILETLPKYNGSGPISEFAGELGDYEGCSVSEAAGLTHLGACAETLMPGSSSSVRHWHEKTDEIVVVLSGVLTLHEDGTKILLKPGEIAAFAAGNPIAHCLINETDRPASFLVVGSRDAADICHYPELGRSLLADGRIVKTDE